MRLLAYISPLTLALALFLNYTLQYFGVWAGFDLGDPPQTAGGICSICGMLQYIDKSHGDVFMHIMRPLTGAVFVYGILILFRDQSQP